MTPEEVFEQLRDVHLPEVDVAQVGGLDPKPLIVFAVIAVVIWLMQVWSRRRAAAMRLRTDPKAAPFEQRDQIVRVTNLAAKQKVLLPVPQSAFVDPTKVTEDDVRDLRKWARRRLR